MWGIWLPYFEEGGMPYLKFGIWQWFLDGTGRGIRVKTIMTLAIKYLVLLSILTFFHRKMKMFIFAYKFRESSAHFYSFFSTKYFDVTDVPSEGH